MRSRSIAFIIGFLLLFCGRVSANEITSLSKSSDIFVDGIEVEIIGIALGSKTNAEPLIWDTFESGANEASMVGGLPDIGGTPVDVTISDTLIKPSYTWSNYKSQFSGMIYSNLDSFDGNQSAYSYFDDNTQSTSFYDTGEMFFTTPQEKVYFHYNYKIDITGNYFVKNGKLGRIPGSTLPSGYGSLPVFRLETAAAGNGYCAAVSTQNYTERIGGSLDIPSPGEWGTH